MIMVCGDSHTATHGAVGALAFGIGASEVAHVLATQTLWQRKPRTCASPSMASWPPACTAKDVILAIIAKIGAAGGTGHVIEYAGDHAGSVIEGRLTSATCRSRPVPAPAWWRRTTRPSRISRAGPMRPRAPTGKQALGYWQSLPSDEDAQFDREVALDAAQIAPMVTWGTSPAAAAPITGAVPIRAPPTPATARSHGARARLYGPDAGQPLCGIADRSGLHRLLHQ